MDLVTIEEATKIIKKYLKREFNIDKRVSDTNILYLIQYGQLKKHDDKTTMIDLDELKDYYNRLYNSRKDKWNDKLGNDLNWHLSFENLREQDTTKHVHRLHPYKGKFIPQLVEYFIDSHVDQYKTEVFFKRGDLILDPFLGSGTTLVQANELGINGIGIDISEFNCLISKCKIRNYDLGYLIEVVNKILIKIRELNTDNKIKIFEKELLNKMAEFNKYNFPSPDFRYQVRRGVIDEDQYGGKKEKEFLTVYHDLIDLYNIKIEPSGNDAFLDKWFICNMRYEIELIYNEILGQSDQSVKDILKIVLSRAIRSCRATKHSDLATLKKPQFKPYYCPKHKKICKPIMTLESKFKQYALDTIKRIDEYSNLKTKSHQIVISADSRNVDIPAEAKNINEELYTLLQKNKIKGIFTSPPYVGNIDYHEQHAYAYELFGLKRKDNCEIGPLFKGKVKAARESYVKGISDVLINCKKFMVNNYHVFIVANDKFNLYPVIAEKAGMRIVNRYKRPVLNRTERDRNPYSEIIFHFREKFN